MSGTIFLSFPYLLIRADKQVVRLMSGTTFLPFPYCLIRENMEYHMTSSLGRDKSELSSRTLASRHKRIVGLASGIVFPAALISEVACAVLA